MPWLGWALLFLLGLSVMKLAGEEGSMAEKCQNHRSHYRLLH